MYKTNIEEWNDTIEYDIYSDKLNVKKLLETIRYGCFYRFTFNNYLKPLSLTFM